MVSPIFGILSHSQAAEICTLMSGVGETPTLLESQAPAADLRGDVCDEVFE